jgi:ABC-2 type transport system ATP-binding protein
MNGVRPHSGNGAGPAIELTGLTKRFGSSVLAVDHLDLRVDHGQVWGLLGPNGAGKTTTLRMLVGLVRPTSGTATLLGTEVKPGSGVLARVGTMIEHSDFVPFLSGIRNLRMHWEEAGGDFATANVEEALAVAGLGSAINRKVKTYSQGMRQRLGIARALLGRPEVLVLDEPTNGLDPGEMREVRDLLRRLAEHGVTVLLSSHLLAEVEQVCSTVVVMDRGRLVATGTIDELTAAGGSVYFGIDDVAHAEQVLSAHPGVRSVTAQPPGLRVDVDGVRRSDLVAALVEAGVGVDTVEASHRLEDAFLGLVGESR